MIKKELDLGAYEYMVWQEWKEGFARVIENRIRDRLGLPQNAGGSSSLLIRTVFSGGEVDRVLDGIGSWCNSRPQRAVFSAQKPMSR